MSVGAFQVDVDSLPPITEFVSFKISLRLV